MKLIVFYFFPVLPLYYCYYRIAYDVGAIFSAKEPTLSYIILDAHHLINYQNGTPVAVLKKTAYQWHAQDSYIMLTQNMLTFRTNWQIIMYDMGVQNYHIYKEIKLL